MIFPFYFYDWCKVILEGKIKPWTIFWYKRTGWKVCDLWWLNCSLAIAVLDIICIKSSTNANHTQKYIIHLQQRDKQKISLTSSQELEPNKARTNWLSFTQNPNNTFKEPCTHLLSPSIPLSSIVFEVTKWFLQW